jgi:hypothetical protein
VFLKTDNHKYLEEKYNEFVKKDNTLKSVLMLDKLHLIKFTLANARKIVDDKKVYIGETFVAVFLHLLKCRTRQQIADLSVTN